ncbi:DUF6712 family protein [Paracoccus sp. (in: a-proteobacteria)]|uniref:DUF6712 family protein n=1 Tax=Paracoccus sp. TaxID=267 RepID=UPI00321F91FC
MLFKTTSKIKEYAEFTEINFASISLTIRQVEEGELVPIIGTALYDSLNTVYTAAADESTLTASEKSLLDKCRMLIAPYVSFYYAPKSEILLSDSGPRRSESANVKTAYGYQVVNFREQKLREAEKAAESLILFLEQNKTDYPLWTVSDEFKNYRSLFIKTGSEFDLYFRSASPQRNYFAWRYKMLDVEEQIIRQKLGDDLFDHLKTIDASASPVFTAPEKLLLVKLKKTIAYFTVCFALPFHSVRIDANGITIIAANSTVTNKDQEPRQPANNSAINQIITSAEKSAQVWLQNAIDFIENNISDFPDYPVPVSNVAPLADQSGSTVYGLI